MNELMYNFINQIEDANKINEMTIEEFTKLVKSNKLISDDDAQHLIESFKKISSKKGSEDESSDNDQRKKKYRTQYQGANQEVINEQENAVKEVREDDNSLER